MPTDWELEQGNVYNDLLLEGVVFTFTREIKGGFNPVTGDFAETTEEIFTAPGIMKMYNSRSSYAQMWETEMSVKVGDKVLLLASGTYSPELEDRVDLQGASWRVKGFTPLQPGIVTLLQYVLIRKG